MRFCGMKQNLRNSKSGPGLFRGHFPVMKERRIMGYSGQKVQLFAENSEMHVHKSHLKIA